MNRRENAMKAMLSHAGTPGLAMTLGAVLPLAIPAIFEQILVTMVQYVDAAMVGSLGAVATAAVGLTASSTWFIGGILSAVAVGFSVQVAQYVGAGELERARSVVGQGIRFALLFGLAVGLAAFALSWPLPHWLGADAEVAPPAAVYFRIVACAVPFNLLSQLLGASIRCAGDAKTPLLLNIGMNLLHVILNWLLIYSSRTVTLGSFSFVVRGAGMGVQGAAVASAVSIAALSGAYVLVLRRKKSLLRPQKGDDNRLSPRVLSRVWRVGLPIALERSLTSLAQIVITGVISSIGTAAVAANHLAVTAESLSYMPAYGLAAAATALTGQAVGANRPDIAKRCSSLVVWMGVGAMTAGGVLLYVLSTPLIRLFTPDPEVIRLGSEALRIVAFAEPFFAMSIVITGVLRGAGDTKVPFLINLATMWGVRITLSLLLYRPLGLRGVWLAMAAELGVRGILFYLRLLRGKWLRNRLI